MRVTFAGVCVYVCVRGASVPWLSAQRNTHWLRSSTLSSVHQRSPCVIARSACLDSEIPDSHWPECLLLTLEVSGVAASGRFSIEIHVWPQPGSVFLLLLLLLSSDQTPWLMFSCLERLSHQQGASMGPYEACYNQLEDSQQDCESSCSCFCPRHVHHSGRACTAQGVRGQAGMSLNCSMLGKYSVHDRRLGRLHLGPCWTLTESLMSSSDLHVRKCFLPSKLL